MKVTLSSIDFNNALNAVFKAIPSRPTHPILSNVLIKTENNCLVISATDLTTFVRVKIPANISEHGSLCIPALPTTKIVKLLPSCELQVSSNEDNILTLSYGVSNSSVISGLSCNEFPEFPTVEIEDHIIVDSGEFIKAFKALISHASKDSTKQSLQGVHLGDRRLITSDGHKIATKNLTTVGGNPQAIMNPSLIKFMPDIKNNKLISVEFGNGFTRVSLSDRVIIQRQYEGNNLSSFKPPMGIGVNLIADRKQLIKLLDLANISDSQDSEIPTCFLSITENGHGNQLEIESSMSIDSMIVNGHDCKSGYSTLVNIKYLLGLLKSTDNKEIEISLPGNLHNLITINAGDLTLGCMPCDPIKDGKVGTAGAGYAPAWELPYKYDNGGLVVIASRYGFTKADDIPVEKILEYRQAAIKQAVKEQPTQSVTNPYKPQTYEQWIADNQDEYAAHKEYCDNLRQEENIKAKAYYQNEPIELLKSSLGDGSKVEKLLKKHYKTIKNFNQKFIGRDGIRTWSQAVTIYENYTLRYQEIVTQVVNESQPVATSTTPQSNAGSVTVDELKLKYGSFKSAKSALGIKAVSWDKLVEKINAQSTNSQPSVEKVIAQLKAKYGKLAYAKCELKIKAVSWIKLAETYMAA